MSRIFLKKLGSFLILLKAASYHSLTFFKGMNDSDPAAGIVTENDSTKFMKFSTIFPAIMEEKTLSSDGEKDEEGLTMTAPA